uniref:BK_channel_a domain-containing protein n=1 Tax=Parastrongyloides trichosuri TaxID=131310 RepID=A0A0N4Z1W9_PARTI
MCGGGKKKKIPLKEAPKKTDLVSGTKKESKKAATVANGIGKKVNIIEPAPELKNFKKKVISGRKIEDEIDIEANPSCYSGMINMTCERGEEEKDTREKIDIKKLASLMFTDYDETPEEREKRMRNKRQQKNFKAEYSDTSGYGDVSKIGMKSKSFETSMSVETYSRNKDKINKAGDEDMDNKYFISEKALRVLKNFITDDHILVDDFGDYFTFLVDVSTFFKKYRLLFSVLSIPFWNTSEILRNATMVVIGADNDAKINFLSYLLQSTKSEVEKKLKDFKEKNVLLYKPDKRYPDGPYGKIKQVNCNIDYGMFNIFSKSFVNCNAFQDSTILTKFNILCCYDPEVSKNSVEAKVQSMNDYIFNRNDIIVVTLKYEKIEYNLNNRLERLKKYSYKVIFIINISNNNVPDKNIKIKKELLRWYVSSIFKDDFYPQIFIVNDSYKDKITSKVVNNETTYFYEWLLFYKSSAVYYRCKAITNCINTAIPYCILLYTLKSLTKYSIVEKDEILKEIDKKYKSLPLYKKVCLGIALENKMEFDEKLSEKSIPPSVLADFEEPKLPNSLSKGRQCPELKYFVDSKDLHEFRFLKTGLTNNNK